jgi:asparagine synthase (glutamine-hydrolysing)
MCGIVGIHDFKNGSHCEDEIRRMCQSLNHRGPDASGCAVFPEYSLGLGHTRLAIIDLTSTGNQPLVDSTGDYTITFNGEIYNYVDLRKHLVGCGVTFKTRTDTEVILEAYKKWGAECVQQLRGMFAFCIFDRRKRILFLARDRAGEKPLFYFHTTSRFIFASELKAIFTIPDVPRQLNHESFEYFLAYGYVPGKRCLVEGFHKLPPGHTIEYDIRTAEVRCNSYWQPPTFESDGARHHLEDLTEGLDELLQQSVREQLVADVPVGILLSGGLDSSLVTAIASRVSAAPVKTFTVSFPGHRKYDEAAMARKVAKHFSTDHHELIAEPGSVDLLPMLAEQFDEPIADSSMVPTYLVSKLIREHATVALGGDGGDELFGGYHQHKWLESLACFRKWIPGSLRNITQMLLAKVSFLGIIRPNYVKALLADETEAIAFCNVLFGEDLRGRLKVGSRNIGVRDLLTPEQYKVLVACRGKSPLQMGLHADFGSYLPDDILVKVDRSSMLASLETRAPFLDHRLVEFAFESCPDHYKANAKKTKILPKMLAKKLLPSCMEDQRKQGFSIPLNDWFRSDWKYLLQDVLQGFDENLISQKNIQRLLQETETNSATVHRLFALTMFELWRQRYAIVI